MEEKVLIKGVFGGKFIYVILYILAIIIGGLFIMIDIAEGWDGMLIATGVISAIILIICGAIISKIMKKRE